MELDFWKSSPPCVEEFVGILFFTFIYLVTANLGLGVLSGVASGMFLGFLNNKFEPYSVRYGEKKRK